jgi:hypothetical protein
VSIGLNERFAKPAVMLTLPFTRLVGRRFAARTAAFKDHLGRHKLPTEACRALAG